MRDCAAATLGLAACAASISAVSTGSLNCCHHCDSCGSVPPWAKPAVAAGRGACQAVGTRGSTVAAGGFSAQPNSASGVSTTKSERMGRVLTGDGSAGRVGHARSGVCGRNRGRSKCSISMRRAMSVRAQPHHISCPPIRHGIVAGGDVAKARPAKTRPVFSRTTPARSAPTWFQANPIPLTGATQPRVQKTSLCVLHRPNYSTPLEPGCWSGRLFDGHGVSSHVRRLKSWRNMSKVQVVQVFFAYLALFAYLCNGF